MSPPRTWAVEFAFLISCLPAAAQSLGGAGTLRGIVSDPADAPIPSALVELSNPVTGFSRQTQTQPNGAFAINNIPPNRYRLRVSLSGFEQYSASIEIRTAVPIDLLVRLEIARQQTSVTVEATPDRILENKPAPSDTIDRQLLTALPALSPDSGLNDAIIFTTPGVAADSNGFFHPLGDHAQVSYILDGQPITDQRNKVFSTSIPSNAIQSMEVISGSPAAEYGDKTSLVINAATRSGLGQKLTGDFLATYGSFGSIGEDATLAAGTSRWGNFTAVNTERSGRFLDTPEFSPIHDAGNTGTVFDRADYQPGSHDAFHLNLMAARNWFQVPNTYDQPSQDQRQKVVSFNIAPGYQHTLDSRTLLSVHAFARRDQVDYYPSRDLLDDSPATLAQDRSLTNLGLDADLARVQGRHNWKAGVNVTHTRLDEEFSLGITDPAYNAPCVDAAGPVRAPGLSDPAQCAAAGVQVNPAFLSTLVPYDLSRSGQPFRFQGGASINQAAAFIQDSVTLGDLTLNIGLRFDRYDGLTDGSAFQPRGAFSYLLKATSTVIRGGYSRTMETPTNENLVASSSTGPGGLASNLFKGTAQQEPIALGRRNQYDAGLQQSLGRWLLVDVSYFRKYTRNAFDFDALFSTPVTFPIGWRQSKLDGVSARISTVDLRGLRIYATMGHANARFFGPETGGIIFNSNLTIGAYRQDHDQVYQQNVNLHYQRPRTAWWTDFTWRYDSGLVVGAVNNLSDALALTADQQTTIGFYCGPDRASLTNRITACNSPDYGAERIHILAPGTENPDRNPPRTTSRHVLDLGVGSDNLFRTDRIRTKLRFTVLNLLNQAALYNFLSPFSGTHWIAPRTYQAQIGWAF
jgi:hypothetical protein